MEKKIAPPLPPKVSVSSKNLKKEPEENIQLKSLQPALKKRYGLIFAKILFRSAPKHEY